jgi:hypothetical protein
MTDESKDSNINEVKNKKTGLDIREEKREQKKKNTIKHVYKYETKPIAKVCRECLQACQEIAAGMSKKYRYQSGTGLTNIAMQLTYCCYDALDWPGFNEEKVKKIELCLTYLRRLVIMIRVIKDVNEVSTFMFEKVILMLVTMKTQILNWLKFIKEKIKEQEKEENKNE